MNRTSAVRLAGAVLLAAGLAAPFSVPAFAAQADATSATNTQSVAPEILAAMQRDLGLDAGKAQALLARQTEASATEQALGATLGDSFGGAWFDAESATLTVGVTDPAKADTVTRAGAVAKVVKHSAAQLDSMVARLNADEPAAPRSITGWNVDSAANQVVMNVLPGGAEAAKSFAASHGVHDVRVVESADAPRTFYDVRGGDAYYISSSRCSIGFAVNGGFVTAGHCGRVGAATSGYNRVAQGTFRGSSFPGNDYAWVGVNSNWTPRGTVTGIGGVAGSAEAATGARVCKSGSTTGVTCGTVGAKNQTVRYAQGTVYGMTATNVTCQAGDSGGGFMAGTQAQGMVSGGNSSVCYFFPVNKALSAYGLTLVRG